MADYNLSPKAQKDIEEIWDYTASRWSIAQAEIYIRELQKTIELVAAQPGLGRLCDDVRKGYYKYSSGSHIIFYRIVCEKIDITRILHSQMDFERHF